MKSKNRISKAAANVYPVIFGNGGRMASHYMGKEIANVQFGDKTIKPLSFDNGGKTPKLRRNKKRGKEVSSTTGLELPTTFETVARNKDVTKPIVKGVADFDYLEDRVKSIHAPKPISAFRSEKEYLDYHKNRFVNSMSPEELQRYNQMDDSQREGLFVAKYGVAPFVGQDRTAEVPYGNVLGRLYERGGKLPLSPTSSVGGRKAKRRNKN